MNEMKIFNSEKFGQVRTVIVDGEVWFVGKDVTGALGYERTADAIRQHVEEDDKGVGEMQTPGGKQNMVIINESGLYALIFGSKLPSAKRFKHWVTSEVLPSIRKTGKYETNNMHSDTTIPRVKGSQTQIPKNGNWYDKVKPKIKLICEVYGIEIKKLYHIILTNIQGVYNWDFAMMTYINETGSAPRYPMQVVAHFQQFQEAAEQVMDILLERAGYGE